MISQLFIEHKIKNSKKIMYAVFTALIRALGSSFLPSAGFGTEEHTVLYLLCLSEMALRRLTNTVKAVQEGGHQKMWF